MDNSHRIVVLLGAPGSGKGTQAMKLSLATGLHHISTGDLFRHHLANQTPIGEKVGSFMAEGRLVPDDLVCDMLFERLAEEDCWKGAILDGFPRTVEQAKLLEKRMGDHPLLIVELQLNDDLLTERLSGRRVCSSCGNIHHVLFHPPKEENHCDLCGGSLIQRKDDRPEVIRERLAVYHRETAPVTHFFREKRKVIVIDGDRDPKEIQREILELVQ